MNENIPTDLVSAGDIRRLEYDWYAGGIPANVRLGAHVYIDTSYGFAPFNSERDPGLTLGDASGAYDRTTFVVGPRGRVNVGAYTVLNGAYLVCNGRIEIGDHCLLAWGSVLTDTWPSRAATLPLSLRREALRAAAHDAARALPAFAEPRPVVLEDNVWVGFDAVVLPGVRLGRGSVVGCKTVVAEDVPPYAVVVGSPARVVRYLDADDTEEERARALREYAR
ncbi:MAG TPA: acyltransferase [Pyrinomonadaceae bacterium]|jgi:acetyltransferase-like isoleucine patch superfamily enzyme